MAYKGVVQLIGQIVCAGDISESPPQVSSAVSINSTTVVVTFNKNMSDVGLTTPGNYVFVGPAAITATIVTKLSPLIVSVTITGEMRTGTGNYTVTVSNVQDMYSNPIHPVYNTATFNGIGVAPCMVSAEVISDKLVRVYYSEALQNTVGLTYAAYYTFTPDPGSNATSAVSVVAEAVTYPTYVDVTVNNAMTIGVNNYNVAVATWTISGIKDKVGNYLDVAHEDVDFNGDALRPRVVSAHAINSFHVRVTFDTNMLSTAELVTPSRYLLTSGSATLSVFSVAVVDARTVELHVLGALADTATYTVYVGPPYDGIVSVEGAPLDAAHHTATFVVDLNTIIIWVSTIGSDATGNGTQAQPYLTIEHALEDFTDGDQLRILDGTYTPTDTIMISGLSGSIFADNPAEVTIQPISTTKFGAAIAVKDSPRFTLQGVNILQATNASSNYVGIYAEDVENFIAFACNISQFNVDSGDAYGIYVSGSGRVDHCQVGGISIAGGGSLYGIKSVGAHVVECSVTELSGEDDCAVIGIDATLST